jgi:8-oxo-dGTP diphosphatase
VDEVKALAFDHDRILATALERLRGKLEYTTLGFELLPKKFTLSELQKVYEGILGRPLDKRNFRRRMLLLDILVPLDEHAAAGPGRRLRSRRHAARPSAGEQREGSKGGSRRALRARGAKTDTDSAISRPLILRSPE